MAKMGTNWQKLTEISKKKPKKNQILAKTGKNGHKLAKTRRP